MTNTLSTVGHLPKRPYSMTNGLMWRVVTSGQPRVPYLFPPRKVAARMDVDKFTVTLQLQQVKSRGGKGGWKGYIHPPPKKANSGLKSKTEIWSQKKLPSEHGQKIPRECGSGNISRGHECRTTEGHKPKPEIGKGIGSCRVSSTTCGHSSPHDGRPALKMDFEFTEWANQDPKRFHEDGAMAKSNNRKCNRGKSKVLFLLPKPHFVSTGQGTQKAKAWAEDTTKQMLGSQLTKMSSVNPKCDGRLRIQLPW